MVTENDINELVTKYTKKEFFDKTDIGTEFLDYRSKVIVSHLWIELLMECIIIKKFKNYEDLVDFDFSKKQKILFGLGIINEDMNHKLKNFNQIRNTFAHEIDPLGDGKITNLIKKYKLSPKNKTNKVKNPIIKAGEEGMIAGMVTGIITRHLVEILWEIGSKN